MSEQNKIDEIKAALAAITPGSWYVQPGSPYDAVYTSHETTLAVVASRTMTPDAWFIAKSPEYITYLLQEIERLQGEVVFWKVAAENQKDNNMKLISVIYDKDEKAREAINIWETATPEDDFDDIMHAVIDEIKDSLAL